MANMIVAIIDTDIDAVSIIKYGCAVSNKIYTESMYVSEEVKIKL